MSYFALYVCILCALALLTPVCTAQEPDGQESQVKSEEVFSEWYKDNTKSEKEAETGETGEIEKEDSPLKRLMTAISIVMVLGVCAYWFTRKFVPKLTRVQGKDVSILETIPLGSNKNLYLLEIGSGQKLLIGSTNENINLLADVTGSLSSQAPVPSAVKS
jgi:flagellar biogenesis protein FliO